MSRLPQNKRKRLGSVQTVEELREKIAKAENALEFSTDPQQREMLEKGIAAARAKIAELEGGTPAPKKEKSQSSRGKAGANIKKKTDSPLKDQCENLRKENQELRKKLREAGKTATTNKGEGDTTKKTPPKKKETTTNKGEGDTKKTPPKNKATTTNKGEGDTTQKTPPKKKATTTNKGEGDTKKTPPKKKATTEKQGETKEKKERKPSQKQIEAKAKKEAKEQEKRVENEAKNQGVNQKVAQKLLEYLFIQSVVRKSLRYKERDITYNSAYNFYNDILFANQARRFNAETPAFAIVQKIFKALEIKINSNDFKTSKGGLPFTSFTKEDWAVLQEISDIDKGFLTAKYAKEFVNISKTGDKNKADALVKKIESAEKKGAVTSATPFYKEMKEAKIKAEKYEFAQYSNALKGIGNKVKSLNGVMAGLGGFKGLGCTCENFRGRVGNTNESDSEGKHHASYHSVADREANPQPATMTVQEIREKEYDYYDLDAKWCKIFDNPAKNFKFMFYGEPGSGKTALSMQFAEYLASKQGLRVLYVTAEEFDSKSFQDKVTLNGLEDDKIVVANRNFREMDLSDYDVIFLDSAQRLKLKHDEFDELVEKYPDKAFVILFQMTKGGDYKGGKDWEHNLDGSVEVDRNTNHATGYKRYTTNGKHSIKVF